MDTRTLQVGDRVLIQGEITQIFKGYPSLRECALVRIKTPTAHEDVKIVLIPLIDLILVSNPAGAEE